MKRIVWVSIVDAGVELPDFDPRAGLDQAAGLAAQADTAVVVVTL